MVYYDICYGTVKNWSTEKVVDLLRDLAQAREEVGDALDIARTYVGERDKGRMIEPWLCCALTRIDWYLDDFKVNDD